MGVNDILVLRAPEVNERLNAMLERLNGDAALREFYLRNPAGLIREMVFPDQGAVPATEINRANRLLYALLSNERFLAWARDYEQNLLIEAQRVTQVEDPAQAMNAYLAVVDRQRIHADIAAAVADTSDAEMIAGLTWRPDLPRIGNTRLPIAADVAVDVETFVYAVAVVAVLVIAVAAVALGVAVPGSEQRVIGRLDVQTVANQLSDSLAQHSEMIRRSGALTDFQQRNAGYIR